MLHPPREFAHTFGTSEAVACIPGIPPVKLLEGPLEGSRFCIQKKEDNYRIERIETVLGTYCVSTSACALDSRIPRRNHVFVLWCRGMRQDAS